MEPGKRAGNVLRASRETGEASRAKVQLPAVLLNPSNSGIVAMLPSAASDEPGTKGALGTNGTNREIPVDRARKT